MNNWIKKIIRAGEKIKKVIRERPSVKEMAVSLWKNCPSCNKLSTKEKIIKDYFICECGFHFDIYRFCNYFNNSKRYLSSTVLCVR